MSKDGWNCKKLPCAGRESVLGRGLGDTAGSRGSCAALRSQVVSFPPLQCRAWSGHLLQMASTRGQEGCPLASSEKGMFTPT
jgi:hypothetical protein